MEKVKIIYTGEGGYKLDREYADKVLEVGKEYTLETVDVDSWNSDVYLKEFPNKTFNSVLFEGKDGFDFMEEYLNEYDEEHYNPDNWD
ncbi:UNVERIFIED_ORG: hypothetical protein B2H93_04775 [Clostridium botulinum]